MSTPGTEPHPRPIAIVVALAEELDAVAARLVSPRLERVEGARMVRGELAGAPVVAAATGVGAERARRGALALIEAVRPAAIIAAGFAGGADPALACGDLLIAEEVIDLTAPEAEAPRRIASDETLVEAARRAAALSGPRAHLGTVGTVAAILGADEKRRLHETRDVRAVDMESLGVARAANVHDVPFLCARAVVDEAAVSLPDGVGRLVTEAGRPRLLGLLGAVLRRPAAAGELLDLRRRARLAGARLAAFLGRLAEAIAAGTPPRGPSPGPAITPGNAGDG